MSEAIEIFLRLVWLALSLIFIGAVMAMPVLACLWLWNHL